MSILEILLLAIGLSMDSFAVSVSSGAVMQKFSAAKAIKTALFLGVFQGLMPVIGWAAGEHFKSMIEEVDHWIAFGLLTFLGVKMILESLRENPDGNPCGCGEGYRPWRTRTLVCISLATSIDALAIGVSFAFLSISILTASAIIFGVTVLSSLAGIGVGLHFGRRLNRWAGIIGGVILIGIGVKILIEHLFFPGC